MIMHFPIRRFNGIESSERTMVTFEFSCLQLLFNVNYTKSETAFHRALALYIALEHEWLDAYAKVSWAIVGT